VLRALTRDEAAATALRTELTEARGADTRYDAALTGLERRLSSDLEPSSARRLASELALLLQASLLLRTAPGVISDVFCATRLGPQSAAVIGSGVSRQQADAVLAVR